MKQEEEWKVQVQTNNEDKNQALATKLEEQTKEIESLRDQVREKNKALHCAKKKGEALQQWIEYMNGMVAREGAMRYQDESMRKALYQQLSEVKRQLEEETHLKDKFMAAEVKARKEIQQLQELHNISLKSAQNGPEKTKKDTQNEAEAARVEFAAQIKEEQDKNTGLQQELELLKASYNDMKLNYETKLKYEKEKNDTLHKELQQEKKSQADRILENMKIVNKIMASKHHLCEQKEKEIQILQEEASERETSFAKELENLKSQLKELTLTNLKLTGNIKPEDEDSNNLGKKTAEIQVMVVRQVEEPLSDSQATEVLVEVSVSAENLPTKINKMLPLHGIEE